MRKIAVLLMVVFLAGCNPLCAQTTGSRDNSDDIDLTALRTKIVKMKREMDKLIKDIVATTPTVTDTVFGDFGQDVRVDVVETDNNIIVTADLPGMDKTKIDVVLEQGKILTISGAREVVQSQTAPGMVRQERMVGKFQRVIELPADCMNEGIKANYKDGVLAVEIPKKKMPKKETVKVKVQ